MDVANPGTGKPKNRGHCHAMKRFFAIALLLAGCSAPPKPAVILPTGTKIISVEHSTIRWRFGASTDYWRHGSVVELAEPLKLTTP